MTNSRVTSDELKRRQVLPPVYFLVALVATVVLAWVARAWRVSSPLVQLAGAVLLAGGLATEIVADQVFKRHGTTVKPFEVSSALVTTGVFRFSRNPMYLGMVFVLVGVALLFGSLVALVPAVALAVGLDRRFIDVEEKMLAERFGDAWTDYRQRTRRWL